MAKKLVFVWSDPKVRTNMMEVIERKRFAPYHNAQYPMFMQERYRNKVHNELLVFGTSIDQIGLCRLHDLKKQEPDLRYIAINIEGVSQEAYHHWSTYLLGAYPDLLIFDPLVGGKVFNKMCGELNA